MGKRMKINRNKLPPDHPQKKVVCKPKIDMKRNEEWRLLQWPDINTGELKIFDNVLISNLGRVKVNNKLKKQRINKDGYYIVGIENNQGNQKLVHRLVAQTFIPNPNNLPVIDHINGNKTDNRACNLRWCTVAQNTQWGFDLGNNISNPRINKILAINKETQEAKIYPSIAEAGRQLNILPQEIHAVLDNPNATRRGCIYFKLRDIDIADLIGDQFGTTANGGVWAEASEGGMRVRVVDDRDNPMTQPAIKKFVNNLLNKIVRNDIDVVGK